MMDKFSTKPVFTKFNMYVIREADRFNSSSANTLLKFLEEPEDNILGFFITNNKENVISTIRSRCQVFSCNYDTDIMESLDEEILTDVKLYLKKIFENKNVEISRLSYGIPMGAEIDYLDEITLDRALSDRKKIS